jgi:hypothetical protein
MSYKTFKTIQEIEAVDIPTMASMTPEEYSGYIRERLLLLDHHEILRSGVAGYPLATTRAQVTALIEYLVEIKPQLTR